jgi:hypothetical protein
MPGSGGGELQSIKRPSRSSNPALCRLIVVERIRCLDGWCRIDDRPKNVLIAAIRFE